MHAKFAIFITSIFLAGTALADGPDQYQVTIKNGWTINSNLQFVSAFPVGSNNYCPPPATPPSGARSVSFTYNGVGCNAQAKKRLGDSQPTVTFSLVDPTQNPSTLQTCTLAYTWTASGGCSATIQSSSGSSLLKCKATSSAPDANTCAAVMSFVKS